MRSLALEAFGGLTGRLIWLGLLNGLWLGLFAASACTLFFRAAPRLSHRVRHSVLVVAIAFIATGPIVLTAVQHSIRTPLRDDPPESEFVVIAGIPPGELHSARSSSAFQRPPERPASSWHSRVPGIGLSRAVALALRIQPIVVAVWLLVVASFLILLVLGMRGTPRLCRTAKPASDLIRERTRRLARRLRLRKAPRVLIHPDLAEPCLCGVYRPVILLPGPWIESASPDRLDAVLAHELAHARRLDPLMNLAQRLVETLFFFHPAVHWLSRSLRRERELCTDALAVRLTRNPLALAKALESVARLRLHSRSPTGLPIAGSSLGGHGQSLLPRIQELIGMTPKRNRLPAWSLAALPAAGLVALLATAVGMADDGPSVSTRPDPATTDVPPQPHATASPDPKSGPPIRSVAHLAVASDRQICFEVRYINGLDANTWRNRFDDRLKPVHQDSNITAWFIEDPCLRDLLTLALGDTAVNVLMAPKITSFEGAKATILNRGKQFYVSGFDKLETAKGLAFKPIVKDVEVGFRVEMTGSFLPDGTRLLVDLRDSSVLSMHTLFRTGQSRDGDVRAVYQVPTAIDRRLQVSCDVPEGSNLVISVGLDEQAGRMGGAAEFASDLLETVGLPSLKAGSVIRERLVVIKPRKIILESKERPVSAIDRAHPAPEKNE
jgi:beta-lactamase regulating signal transducer with metallopeptidase domain